LDKNLYLSRGIVADNNTSTSIPFYHFTVDMLAIIQKVAHPKTHIE